MLAEPTIRIFNDQDRQWWHRFFQQTVPKILSLQRETEWPLFDLLSKTISSRSRMTSSVEESLVQLEQTIDKPVVEV